MAEVDFVNLLRSTHSDKDEERNHAEKVLANLKKERPGMVMQQLVLSLRTSADTRDRIMAGVHLRLFCDRRNNLIKSVPKDAFEKLKEESIALVEKEQENSVRVKLVHVIAQLAAECVERKEPWDGVVRFCLSLGESPIALNKQLSLTVIDKVAEYTSDEIIGKHLRDVHQMVSAMIVHAEIGVAVASFKAIVSLLLALPSTEQREHFLPLMIPMMAVIKRALAVSEGDAVECLQALVSLNTRHPTFVRPYLREISGAMLDIAHGKDLDAATRQMALQFLVALAEHASSMIRKAKPIIEAVVPLSIGMLGAVDDEDDWGVQEQNSSTFTGEDVDDEVVAAGEMALDTVARHLGGKAVFPILSKHVLGMLKDGDDWRKRRAALVALAICTDGCKKQYMANIGPISTAVIKRLLEDPHPRVRYNAAHAIGQFAIDLTEVKGTAGIHKAAGKPLLKALCEASQSPINAEWPRVRGHCTVAITQLMNHEYMKRGAVNADAVADALFSVLKTGNFEAQAKAISGFAAMANVIDSDMAKYYDALMPVAKGLLRAEGKSSVHLKANTIEAIGAVCQAVGASKCADDAKEIMGLLMRVMKAKLADDDTETFRMVCQATVRLANTLQEQFSPFLPNVIGYLIRVADQEVKVVVVDSEPGDKEAIPGMSTLVMEPEGHAPRKVGYDEEVVSRKSVAALVLTQYIEALGDVLEPVLERLTRTMIALMDFTLYDPPRRAAIIALPRLVRMLPRLPGDLPQKLMLGVVEKFSVALTEEKEMDMLAQIAASLCQTMEAVYEHKGANMRVPISHVTPVLKQLQACMSQSANRRIEAVKESKADVDFDEEAMELLEEGLEVEEELLHACEDTVGFVVKMHRGAVVEPLHKEVLGYWRRFWDSEDEDPVLAGVSHSLVIQSIEYGMPEAAPMFEPLVAKVSQVLLHKSPNVRMAATYAAGLVVQVGGDRLAPAKIQKLCEQLMLLLKSPDATEGDYGASHDNAVRSLLRILQTNGKAMGEAASKGVFQAIADKIPLEFEAEEARAVHGWYLDQIIAGNPMVLSQGHEVIMKQLGHLAVSHLNGMSESDLKSLVSDEDAVKLHKFVVGMQKSVPDFQSKAESIPPMSQAGLRAILSGRMLPPKK